MIRNQNGYWMDPRFFMADGGAGDGGDAGAAGIGLVCENRGKGEVQFQFGIGVGHIFRIDEGRSVRRLDIFRPPIVSRHLHLIAASGEAA